MDRSPAHQRHQRSLVLVCRPGAKAFCNSTAAFNQVALPKTAVRVDVRGIEQCCGVGKKGAKPVDYQPIEVAGRYAPAVGTVLSCPSNKSCRDVVMIVRPLLDCVGWREPLTALVKHH